MFVQQPCYFFLFLGARKFIRESQISDAAKKSWVQEDILSVSIKKFIHKKPIDTRPSVDYFADLLTDEILASTVFQSNLYATQKDVGTKFQLSVGDLKKFIGIKNFMGVIYLPSIGDYWKAKTQIPQVADVMSRVRFKQVQNIIHFNDNEEAGASTDRFYEICPLLNGIRSSFL